MCRSKFYVISGLTLVAHSSYQDPHTPPYQTPLWQPCGQTAVPRSQHHFYPRSKAALIPGGLNHQHRCSSADSTESQCPSGLLLTQRHDLSSWRLRGWGPRVQSWQTAKVSVGKNVWSSTARSPLWHPRLPVPLWPELVVKYTLKRWDDTGGKRIIENITAIALKHAKQIKVFSASKSLK